MVRYPGAVKNQILAVVALVALVWWAWPKGKSLPPEQAVEAAIDEMITAVDEGDPKALILRLSDRFDGQGHNRQEAKGMIVMRLQRRGWSRIFVIDREVTATTAAAVHASLTVVMARGQNVDSIEDLLPQNAGAYRFSLNWELEDDTWRVVTAEWKRVSI